MALKDQKTWEALTVLADKNRCAVCGWNISEDEKYCNQHKHKRAVLEKGIYIMKHFK